MARVARMCSARRMTLDELTCIDIALELFANGIATSAHQFCFADLVAGDDALIARSMRLERGAAGFGRRSRGI